MQQERAWKSPVLPLTGACDRKLPLPLALINFKKNPLKVKFWHTPDFVFTHFLLPTCWRDPPVVKLNWCPPHDEYKPRATPSAIAPIGCTHFPLRVCLRLPLSKTNSNLAKEHKRLYLTQIEPAWKQLILRRLYIFLMSVVAVSLEFRGRGWGPAVPSWDN